MRRWHEEEHIGKRRVKAWNYDYMTRMGDGAAALPERTRQVGRYRKRHPFACGNPRCGICHSYKFPKRELTRNEQIAELNFKEQVDDNRGSR